MIFQLTYFKTIDLSGTPCAQKIKDTLSLLIDHVSTYAIPEEPVIVKYTSSNAFRIMSADVLQKMWELKQSRINYLSQHPLDRSKIALSLKESKQFSTLENNYKAFLESLIAANYSYDEIMILCKEFEEKWDFYSSVDSQLKDKELFNHIRSAISPKNQKAFAEFAKCFTPELMTKEFIAITSFVDHLALQQKVSFQEYQNYKEPVKGLRDNELSCPYTRLALDGRESLTTEDKAQNFIDIYMVLAMMAKVNEPEINEFLEGKPDNYMQQCEQKLYCYLSNSWTLGFTKAETKLLLDMGVSKIKLTFKRDHSHLWQPQECTPKQNVLKILIDYSKLDSPFPAVSLFFTAHNGRHHHELVKRAVSAIARGEAMNDVLDALESKIRKHADFNEEGSLMCRLRFIDMHRGPRPAIEKVAVKTPLDEVVFSAK